MDTGEKYTDKTEPYKALEPSRVAVTNPAAQPPRQATAWLIRTLGKKKLAKSIVRHVVIRMETVTISPKFQIVIPQKIREAMGLRTGEKAHMISFRNRIEVIPVRDIRALRGYLKGIDTSFVRDGDRG